MTMLLDSNKDREIKLESLQAEFAKLKEQASLAQTLIRTLKDTLSNLMSIESSHLTQSEDQGKSVLAIFKEAVIQLKNLKQEIDLTPVVQLTAEVALQNKRIIDLLNSQPHPENLLPIVLDMLKRQNDLLEKALLPLPPVKQSAWEFEVVRHRISDKIQKVIAKQQ